MKSYVGCALIVTLGTIAVSCGGGSGSESDTPRAGSASTNAVISLVKQQEKLLNDANWKAFYETCSAEFRNRTGPAMMSGLFLSMAQTKRQVRNIQVNVEGQTAYVTAEHYQKIRGVKIRGYDDWMPISVGGYSTKYLLVGGKWYQDDCLEFLTGSGIPSFPSFPIFPSFGK
jgi:hypothetical protein